MMVRYHYIHTQGGGKIHLLHPVMPQSTVITSETPLSCTGCAWHPQRDRSHPRCGGGYSGSPDRPAQIVHQNGRGRDTVHIIVAENSHVLPGPQGPVNARCRPVHILHQKQGQGGSPRSGRNSAAAGTSAAGNSVGSQHGGQKRKALSSAGVWDSPSWGPVPVHRH